jgi:hypothetical protein
MQMFRLQPAKLSAHALLAMTPSHFTSVFVSEIFA